MSFRCSRLIEALGGAVTSKTPSSPVNELGDGLFRGPRSERAGIKASVETEVRGQRGLLGRGGSVSAREVIGREEPRVGGGGGAAASGESDAEQRF